MAAREQLWGWVGALLWGGVRNTFEGGVGRAGDSLDWFSWCCLCGALTVLLIPTNHTDNATT